MVFSKTRDVQPGREAATKIEKQTTLENTGLITAADDATKANLMQLPAALDGSLAGKTNTPAQIECGTSGSTSNALIMNYYDSILFDFDGVLADTEPIHHACWREVLAPFGIDLDWETYRTSCIGRSDWEILVMLGRQHNPPLDPHKLYAARPGKQRIFAARMEADPPISSATVDLISSLQDYRLAVVSSSDVSEIEPPLVASGIRAKLAAVVTASHVQKQKPDPEPYLLAARLLKAKRPLVVEDSPTGIASATAAGFDVLRVENPATMPAALRSWLEHKNNFR